MWPGRDLYRDLHDVSCADGFVSPQSVPFRRYDLGPDVCVAWPGGCIVDNAGDDTRLLRTPSGKATDHEIDDLRLDGS